MDLSGSESSYNPILHPNQERGDFRYKRIHSGCAKYLHRFDELIMKPIFIYKYERNMQKKSKEFFDLFMKQGDEIENEFKLENRKISREETIARAVMLEDGRKSAVGTDHGKGSNAGFSYISRQFTKTKRRVTIAKKVKEQGNAKYGYNIQDSEQAARMTFSEDAEAKLSDLKKEKHAQFGDQSSSSSEEAEKKKAAMVNSEFNNEQNMN